MGGGEHGLVQLLAHDLGGIAALGLEALGLERERDGGRKKASAAVIKGIDRAREAE